jgi:ferritin
VADNNGFVGIANSFRHAAEERNHMMKILEYILKSEKPKSVLFLHPQLTRECK